MSARTVFRKSLKVLALLAGSLLLLVAFVAVLLTTPFGKEQVRKYTEGYLQKKLRTTVRIGGLDYSIPDWIELKGIYLEDLRKDTLLYAGEIRVDLSMMKLLSGEADIQSVLLKDVVANISRTEKSSAFNFDFIADAFSSADTVTTVSTDTSAFPFSLGRLKLDNVRFNMNDLYGGQIMRASIADLAVQSKKIDLSTSDFSLKELKGKSVDFYMRSWDTGREPASVETTDESVPFRLLADRLELEDFNFLMDGQQEDLLYENKVNRLSLVNAEFDLEKTFFSASSAALDSSAIRVIMPPSVKDTSATAPNTWKVKIDRLQMNNNSFAFDDNSEQPQPGLDAFHMNAKQIDADIANLYYTEDSTSASIGHFAFQEKCGLRVDTAKGSFFMAGNRINLQDMVIKTPESRLQQDLDLTLASGPKGLDPQKTLVDARMTRSRLSMNDVYLILPDLRSTLPPKDFAGQSVFVDGSVKGSLARLSIPGMEVSGFGGSFIRASGTLTNLTQPEKFTYDLRISRSRFLKSDLMKFTPPEYRSELASLPRSLDLSGKFSGDMRSAVADVDLKGGDLAFRGLVKISDFDKPALMKMDVNMKEVAVSRDMIKSYLPADLPVRIPDKIRASGSFMNRNNSMNADLELFTSLGKAAINGYINNYDKPESADYDLVIRLKEFDAGKFAEMDSVLGKVTGTLYAKGRGFDYKTMASDFRAELSDASVYGYNYKNISADASLERGKMISSGNVQDPSVRMSYSTDVDLAGEFPLGRLKVSVDTIMLKELNLTDEYMDLSFDAELEARDIDPAHPELYAVIDSIRWQTEDSLFALDSFRLRAFPQNGENHLAFSCPLADMSVTGSFSYDKIMPALTAFIDRYYYTGTKQVSLERPQDQKLRFTGVVKRHAMIADLVEGLQDYDNIDFSGSFNSALPDSALVIRADLPLILYDGNIVSGGRFWANSDARQIKYRIETDSVSYYSNVFHNASVRGAVEHDSISVEAATSDDNGKDWFYVSAMLFLNSEQTFFRFNKNMLLNYEHWDVARTNYVSFSDSGLLIRDLLLISDTSVIYVNSEGAEPGSPIEIVIDNFNIKGISPLISTDSNFMSGVVDARLVIGNLNGETPSFDGNFDIDKFTLMDYVIGKINLRANKKEDDLIELKMGVDGRGNKITAKGNFYPDNEDELFDIDIDIEKLSLPLIEAFAEGNLKNVRGNASGKLRLHGNAEDPMWDGYVNFDSAYFMLTELGAGFRIVNQKIILQHPNISFNKFTLTDTLRNPLYVDGRIRVRSFLEYDFDLDLTTRDLIVLKKPKVPTNPIAGFASLDAFLHIGGSLESPDIQGSVYVNDGSDIVLYLPETSFNQDESRRLVRFIDRDTFYIDPNVSFRPEVEQRSFFVNKFNYNLNLEITKASALTIVIDASTGDEIKMEGNAVLNAGVDPGGNLIISGTYTLEKGHYVFNYQVVQRKFNLVKGSTVVFSGDPMEGRISASAEYIANTPSKELLSNEISSMSPSLTNSLNQKLPYRVILKMSGVISQPEIGFDIKLPEDNSVVTGELRTSIDNKLLQMRNDESLMNKQVFSLLLLNRFISEQSSDFFQTGGQDFTDMARSSVSSFLSSAINEIAASLLTGIDVDLNLNSYRSFTNGTNENRTDLSVALSKKFFNDRLWVTVGKSFGIEGSDPSGRYQEKANIFIPDASVSYKLSEDGKYLIRAYRKSQYEVLLDGYIIETGLAFVVTMDYDHFREIFNKSKEKKVE